MQEHAYSFVLVALFSLLPLIRAVAVPESLPLSRLRSIGATVGGPINTTSGTIIGHAAQSYPAVSEYLGIPFAQPPVGDLRFMPPQPFESNVTINADKQAASCIQAPEGINYSQPLYWQNIAASGGTYRNNSSEDCLYLNVWTSLADCGQPLKPVLVWLYGGGFHSGAAADPSEQGAVFAAEHDVVMVSFNYRLGIFGFSGAPGQTQNVALLDQRAVLEWVRENIQAFGGDPTRIIIFGHSAGGASVDLYDFAWVADPIIAGTIIMSGTAHSFGNRFPNISATAWYESAALAGCGNYTTTSDSAILDCMRNTDAKTLFTASTNASANIQKTLPYPGSLYAGITGVIGPQIDNVTVFENYTLQGIEGKFIQKPILTGNNIDEGCFFTQVGDSGVSVNEDALVTQTIFTCPINRGAIWRSDYGVKT